MDNHIEAAKVVATSLDVNPKEDFKRQHRCKVIPKRYDPQNEYEAYGDINTFYRQDFFTVLHVVINFFDKNISEVLKIIQPLIKIFSFTLSKTIITNIATIEAAISLYPCNKPDPYSLKSQHEVFLDICIEKSAATMEDVMKIAIELLQFISVDLHRCFILLLSTSVNLVRELLWEMIDLILA